MGGTNPALLEAMGSHAFIIARSVNFNHEVLEKGGIYYENDIDSLKNCFNLVYLKRVDRIKAIDFCVNKVKIYYNWDRIAQKYRELIEKL